MKPVPFATTDALSYEITAFFGRAMARFFTNIEKYKRDSDGSYTYAWTGTQVVGRLVEDRTFDLFLASGLPRTPARFEGDEKYPLIVNGTLLGHVWIWVPYAYQSNVLYLELAPQFHYDTRVPRRFAMFAGYYDPTFDLDRLTVAQPQSAEGDDLIFL